MSILEYREYLQQNLYLTNTQTFQATEDTSKDKKKTYKDK